ncbi:MAG TPA: AAA family ATPase [Verrucomicrobiae bacterium]|nr:AAA family ATPase [Verrucomicrobiae bacterium]
MTNETIVPNGTGEPGPFEIDRGTPQDALTSIDKIRKDLEATILTFPAAANLEIPPRELILPPFFYEGDLGYVYSPRGQGKTWFALDMAIAIAEGRKFGPWVVKRPRKVLYIDGEMPFDDILTRGRLLSGGKLPENLLLWHHQVLFHRRGSVLNLACPELQSALTEYAVAKGIAVLFLDNISCLMGQVAENDADAWGELVGPWLLDLRRRKIAVVLIHHAGRNGRMRGTSKREDAAFWSIRLTPSQDSDEARDGASFVATFDKNRNAVNGDCPPLAWKFKPDGERVIPDWSKREPIDVFLDLVRNGLESCREIAEEMNVTKGCVSKLAKKAEIKGLIENRNGRYSLKGS